MTNGHRDWQSVCFRACITNSRGAAPYQREHAAPLYVAGVDKRTAFLLASSVTVNVPGDFLCRLSHTPTRFWARLEAWPIQPPHGVADHRASGLGGCLLAGRRKQNDTTQNTPQKRRSRASG